MLYDINGKPISNVKRPFIHISIDDVEFSITNISTGTLSSIFQDPFIAMLRGLHDDFGAVFSLYPHKTDTSGFFSLPAKYKSDFVECSQWLKFGYHCYASENLESGTESDATTRYNNFAAVIAEKANGICSIDRMPRLNNIDGSAAACAGLRKANAGIIGLLGASTNRNAYYLDNDKSQYLKDNAIYYDIEAGLVFLDTSMCLDWFVSGYSSQSQYDEPVEDNPYDELVRRHSISSYGKHFENLEVYGHEWQVYDSSYALNETYADYIRQVCQFAYDYGYDFDYPQNRLANITSFAGQFGN